MTWSGDPRTTTAEWRALRRRILARDHGICHVCHWPGADEVDHVDGNKTNDNPANLAPIHDDPCHRLKSAREGVAARARQAALRKRPPEPHPAYR